MTFIIDCGGPQSEARTLLHEVAQGLDMFEDAILDRLPADATPEQFDVALVALLIGLFRERKSAATVRRHFWKFAPHLRAMSERSPAAHDELILEFIGRLDELT